MNSRDLLLSSAGLRKGHVSREGVECQAASETDRRLSPYTARRDAWRLDHQRAREAEAGRSDRGKGLRLLLLARPRTRWVNWLLLGVGVPGLILVLAGIYFWISYGRMIDAKLGGEQRPIPRIFGRPFEIRPRPRPRRRRSSCSG